MNLLYDHNTILCPAGCRSCPSLESVVSELFVYEKGLEQTFDQCTALVTPTEWEEEKVLHISTFSNSIRIITTLPPSQLKYNAEEGQAVFPMGILIETKPREGMSITVVANYSYQNKCLLEDKKNPPLVGLEPTTFELEVQCANPLRHRGCHCIVVAK